MRRRALEEFFAALWRCRGLSADALHARARQARSLADRTRHWRWTVSSPSALTCPIGPASGPWSRSSVCALPTASWGDFATRREGRRVGSLLLGLYDDAGLLHHVGFTSAIADREKPALTLGSRRWSHPRVLPGRARWAEPLEHRAIGRMAAAAARTRCRGALRPRDRRPLPPWHDASCAGGRTRRRASARLRSCCVRCHPL